MRIRKKIYRSGNVGWEADCGKVNGKRLQKYFATRKEAERYLDEVRRKISAHGHEAFGISEEERILFSAAQARLAAVGASITAAVEFYLAHHKPLAEPITLRQALDRCALDKELAGATPRYMTQFVSSCGSFLAGREELLITEVTKELVRGWILGKGFAPKTQRTYLGDVRTLLSWAVENKLIATNPILGKEGFIPLHPEEDREIEVLDVSSCARLLRVALLGRAMVRRENELVEEFAFRPLIGYLAIAMFCGVRPDEIKRTTVRELDLRVKTLIIEGKRAKTKQRRVIEIPRVALVWLRLWRRLCPEEERLVGKNFDRRWKELRKVAAIGAWPHDALRHTAATFHFSLHQNAAALQAMLGHSEDEATLWRHYRAVRTISGRVVSKKMAEEFWSMTPRKVRLQTVENKL